MKAPRAKCDFCNEFSGKPGNAFQRIYAGTPESRVLFRSNQFVVMPSLGQILEGYLLVLPIKHFKALSDLPGLLLEEFAAISECVGKILKGAPFLSFLPGLGCEALSFRHRSPSFTVHAQALGRRPGKGRLGLAHRWKRGAASRHHRAAFKAVQYHKGICSRPEPYRCRPII